MVQNEPDKLEVGKRIRSLRNKNGLTLEEFGQIFDPPASKSIVSRWESGKSIPSSNRIKEISDHFKVSAFYLLYGRKTIDDIPGENVLSAMLDDNLTQNDKKNYDELYRNSMEESIQNVLNGLDLANMDKHQILYLAEALIPIEDSYSEVQLRLMHGLLNSINRLAHENYSVTEIENGMIIGKNDKEAIKTDIAVWAARINEYL